MDELQRYGFDTQGCLVLRAVLDAGEVARLRQGIPRGADGRVVPDGDAATFRGLLDLPEPLFRDLICHPCIEPILSAVLRGHAEDPCWDRPQLTHEFGLAFRAGETGPWFHNGGTPHRPWLAYAARDQRIFCGLVTVVWCLSDCGTGEGGFWYIPGSHRAAFALPDPIRTYQVTPEYAVQPAVRAGDAIIFTEALTHGTRTWSGAAERLALFYKYQPGLTSQPRALPRGPLEERQRRWLEPGPPFTG